MLLVALALSVLAEKVAIVAAMVVLLAGVTLPAAALLLVLALAPVGVTDQALPAVVIDVTGVALETPRLSRDVLTKGNAAESAEPSHGERAAGGCLDDAAAVRSLAEGPGQIIETIRVHAFLPGSTPHGAHSCRARV